MTTTTIPPIDTALSVALSGVVSAARELAKVDPCLTDPGELGESLALLERTIDLLRGVSSDWAAAFEAAHGHEDQGAPTLTAWLRRELRLTAGESRRRGLGSRAMAALPQARDALVQGEIGAGHVDVLGQAVHRYGPDLMRQYEDVLIDVARACDADELRRVTQRLGDIVDPDAADARYLRAMERRDISVVEVGDGFNVRGFLDPETGVAFREVLYAASKPSGESDARTAGQRRCDALRDLCSSVLAHGLPTDRGFRPQLFVTVPVDRLERALGGRSTKGMTVDPSATLDGFGEISDLAIERLACDCIITPVIIDGAPEYPAVLDVGRTRRLATLRQREAIFVQQGGRCFNPGCANTHLEIHHMVPWSLGGATDLRDLRGYCTRCHHLIHERKLRVEADGQGGWRHRRRTGEPLIDHRRRTMTATRVFRDALLDGGLRFAMAQHERWRMVPG